MLFIVGGVVAVLLISSLAAAGYFFSKYKSLQKESKATTQTEEGRIKEKVGKLYNTPGEEPSIAQVEDQSKVQNQTFFKDAQKGDYILIYQQAKLAILYREGTNKIINTGPIVLPGSGQQSSGTGSVAGDSTP